MVTFFRERGARVPGAKLGSRGCALYFDGEYVEVPAYRVDVADTCGAGDAFMAGFLAAITQGKNHREAALFGNAIGALCVRAIGTTTGIPSFEEALSFQANTEFVSR